MQPSQELLRGARGELLIFYQKEIACNTAGCRVSKKWLNATFSSFFHPVLAPMARSAPNAKNENLWVFIRSDAHVVRAGLNIRGCGPLSTPGVIDRLRLFKQPFIYNFRRAFLFSLLLSAFLFSRKEKRKKRNVTPDSPASLWSS